MKQATSTAVPTAVTAAVCLIAGGCFGGGGPERRTADTAVIVHASPYSGYVDSGVVRRGGSVWLATVTATQTTPNTVRVYRWSGRRWAAQGTVRLPEMSPITSGG